MARCDVTDVATVVMDCDRGHVVGTYYLQFLFGRKKGGLGCTPMHEVVSLCVKLMCSSDLGD